MAPPLVNISYESIYRAISEYSLMAQANSEYSLMAEIH